MMAQSGTLYCVLDGLEKCRQSNETEAGLRNLMEAISKFFRTENHEVWDLLMLTFPDRIRMAGSGEDQVISLSG